MCDNGVPIETIADLCGHSGTAVTEEVYRFQLKPVIRTGAEPMNSIFGSKSVRVSPSKSRDVGSPFGSPRLCKIEKGAPDSSGTPSHLRESVGVAGFEPTTSSSRTKRATKLRYTPVVARG